MHMKTKKETKGGFSDLDKDKPDLFKHFDQCQPCRICSPRKVISNRERMLNA